MKIAILFDQSVKQHSTTWSIPWVQFCVENKIDYKIINPYINDVLSKLMVFDIILWHYSNYSFTDMLMAKNILFTLEEHGKKVFPSFKDAWHFDDKLAETYLLESINAPIPKSFYYYDIKDLKNDINSNILSFPIIAKLRNGSGSHNVKMIKSEKALLTYAKRMFSSGINSAPSLIYKASSNIRSLELPTYLRQKVKQHF